MKLLMLRLSNTSIQLKAGSDTIVDRNWAFLIYLLSRLFRKGVIKLFLLSVKSCFITIRLREEWQRNPFWAFSARKDYSGQSDRALPDRKRIREVMARARPK